MFHARPEQHARRRRRPQQLVERRLRVPGHPRPRLRAEVLDDHLLHMPVALAELADREQRFDPFRSRFADPDQDAGGERHGRLAREPQRLEPPRRELVRRAEVRPAARRQPLRGRLQHDPLRRADPAQPRQVRGVHHARVHMRQETRLLEHGPRCSLEILERRRAPQPGELLTRRAVAQLRLVAQREQRLVATGRRTRARDREHFVDRHVRPLPAPRRARERAVVADVPAELRQRDEDLRRIRDERPGSSLADGARLRAQLVRRRLDERKGSIAGAYGTDSGAGPGRRDPRGRSDDRRRDQRVLLTGCGELRHRADAAHNRSGRVRAHAGRHRLRDGSQLS